MGIKAFLIRLGVDIIINIGVNNIIVIIVLTVFLRKVQHL